MSAQKATRFGVSVFGSARVSQDCVQYNQAEQLGTLLANENIDLVTGGGPGIMEAAAKGHASVQSGAHSWGLTIALPYEDGSNDYNQITEHFLDFPKRLERFMSLSNAVVVMEGGIGTGLEFFFTWQLMQVQHIENMPIILMGEQWMYLRQWVRRYMLAKGYVDKVDLDMLYIVQNNENAMKILTHTQKSFLENKKYRNPMQEFQIDAKT